MQVERIAKATAPLCFLPDGRLLCYSSGNVIVMNKGLVEKSIPIKISLMEKLLGKCRLLYRFLRLGVRASIALNNEIVILSIGNYLYELELESGFLSEGWYCGKGIRPLTFTRLEGISGFDDGFYFGGYLNNMDKKPVHIYKRISKDRWDVVYTFPNGSINHVHNLVADSYRNCIWAFTGDFGESSAIWKINNNFNTVERYLYNDQKYRGCVAFALPEGLLYATDAPFIDDYIYLFDPISKGIKQIMPIDGSCIYGCQWKDKFAFSSTVEGDGRDENIFEFLFGRKRGAGIKNDFTHIYVGNFKSGFEEIYNNKKDTFPFSFQFGTVIFPSGINCSDRLVFQPVATKKNDLDMLYYTS